MEQSQTLNNQIRQLVLDEIKERRISKNALAQRSGVTRQNVQTWFLGKIQNPRLDTLLKIMNVVGYELTITPRKKA